MDEIEKREPEIRYTIPIGGCFFGEHSGEPDLVVLLSLSGPFMYRYRDGVRLTAEELTDFMMGWMKWVIEKHLPEKFREGYRDSLKDLFEHVYRGDKGNPFSSHYYFPRCTSYRKQEVSRGSDTPNHKEPENPDDHSHTETLPQGDI